MPATPSNSTIFAFTPRQVLLSNQTMKHTVDNGTLTLKPEQKLLLHRSIAHYLHHIGFSKSLKKFRSESQIEKDNLEGSSIDLEEMCLKYLEICGKDAKSNINDEKEQATDVSKNKEEDKSKEKKKKSKMASQSHANNVEDNQLELPTLITEKKAKDDVSADAKVVNGAETANKSKDKKKKKDKTSSQGDAGKQIEDPNDTVSKKDKALHKEVREDEKKDSKKRERPTSAENGQKVADRKEDGETKRKKVEKLNESKGGEQSAKTNADLGSDGDQLQKTPNEQAYGKTNGHLESAGEKPSVQKSQKSQEKGSAEQKSAKKAFQRVQADKHTYDAYQARLEEVTSQAESTPGSQPPDVAQKMQIWRDVSGGVTRGRCYRIVDLSANVSHRAPTLTQESAAPGHNSRYGASTDTCVARAEEEAARAEERAARAEERAAWAEERAARAEEMAATAEMATMAAEMAARAKEEAAWANQRLDEILARLTSIEQGAPSAPPPPRVHHDYKD